MTDATLTPEIYGDFGQHMRAIDDSLSARIVLDYARTKSRATEGASAPMSSVSHDTAQLLRRLRAPHVSPTLVEVEAALKMIASGDLIHVDEIGDMLRGAK